MPITSGSRLGPYEIVAPIGAGGMGEVFKARDTRLNRTVAIKVLPAALAGDPELRAEINQGLVAVLRSFIADQKSGVSSFIADQVKAWDMAQLISLIEINIGKDLQYIRFNGSLIGGLAGLGLYSIEFVLRLL